MNRVALLAAVFAACTISTASNYPPAPETPAPVAAVSTPATDIAATIASLDRAPATAEPAMQVASLVADAKAKPPTRTRVVIISQDGMRPDALALAHAPNHHAFMREGMVARRASTVKPSETLASHASMLSGFPVADHKMNFDAYAKNRGQIPTPTIFSIAKQNGLHSAMFIGKQKLWHIAPDKSVSHFERPGFFCKTVATRAAKYFETVLPDVMFVHITDPDNAGHDYGWMSRAYMAAVRESDRCVQILLDAIDRAGQKSSTLVILTADHGGHERQHSGRGKELDSTIPWIARGPSIPAGTILDVDVNTTDTAVTALAALGLPTVTGMVGVSHFSPAASFVRSR